jgi:hypothetical protein
MQVGLQVKRCNVLDEIVMDAFPDKPAVGSTSARGRNSV